MRSWGLTAAHSRRRCWWSTRARRRSLVLGRPNMTSLSAPTAHANRTLSGGSRHSRRLCVRRCPQTSRSRALVYRASSTGWSAWTLRTVRCDLPNSGMTRRLSRSAISSLNRWEGRRRPLPLPVIHSSSVTRRQRCYGFATTNQPSTRPLNACACRTTFSICGSPGRSPPSRETPRARPTSTHASAPTVRLY